MLSKDVFGGIRRLVPHTVLHIVAIKPQDFLQIKVKHNILPDTLFPLQHDGYVRFLCRVLNLLREPGQDEPEVLVPGNDGAEVVKYGSHKPLHLLVGHRAGALH